MFSGLVVLFAYIKNLKLLNPRGEQLKVPSLFKISWKSAGTFLWKHRCLDQYYQAKGVEDCWDLFEWLFITLLLLLVIRKCDDCGFLFCVRKFPLGLLPIVEYLSKTEILPNGPYFTICELVCTMLPSNGYMCRDVQSEFALGKKKETELLLC